MADGRLSITADVYYTKKNAFVSPLTIETPLLFLDEDDLVTYLTTYLPPPTATFLASGIALIPLRVVSSDQVGAQGADLILSYRNVGDFNLWGADVAFQVSLTNRWSVGGAYSHISEDYIQMTGQSPVALNAPKDKGSLNVTFRDVVSGFTASGGARFTSSFPAKSADFIGTACVLLPAGTPRPLF